MSLTSDQVVAFLNWCVSEGAAIANTLGWSQVVSELTALKSLLASGNAAFAAVVAALTWILNDLLGYAVSILTQQVPNIIKIAAATTPALAAA